MSDLPMSNIISAAKNDEEFQNIIKQAAKRALLVQIDLMNNGTPEQRLAAASRFNPVLIKALGGEDTDDEVAEAKAKMRKVIGGMLKPKRTNVNR